MWKNMNKPDFGVLDGLKVVHSAGMAGPMGATMLADHGADLIWLENPPHSRHLALRYSSHR